MVTGAQKPRNLIIAFIEQGEVIDLPVPRSGAGQTGKIFTHLGLWPWNTGRGILGILALLVGQSA